MAVDHWLYAIQFQCGDEVPLLCRTADKHARHAYLSSENERRRNVAAIPRKAADQRDMAAKSARHERLGQGTAATDLHDVINAAAGRDPVSRLPPFGRSEEHTSELQSLMRISYAVFCLKKKQTRKDKNESTTQH